MLQKKDSEVSLISQKDSGSNMELTQNNDDWERLRRSLFPKTTDHEKVKILLENVAREVTRLMSYGVLSFLWQ